MVIFLPFVYEDALNDIESVIKSGNCDIRPVETEAKVVQLETFALQTIVFKVRD